MNLELEIAYCAMKSLKLFLVKWNQDTSLSNWTGIPNFIDVKRETAHESSSYSIQH